jgi:hypothetical protein
MSSTPDQIQSLTTFRNIIRRTPVIQQWPWTTGVPLTAGTLVDDVEKLRTDDMVEIGHLIINTIQVHASFFHDYS